MKIKLLISNFNCSCISDKCPWKALYMFIHAFGSFMVFFLLYFFIVVQVRLSPLSTHHAPPPHPPPPSHLNPTPLWLCPQVLYTCSLMIFPLLSPIISLDPPLWLLLVCSLFQCLWLYFARLLVLLIRFHL